MYSRLALAFALLLVAVHGASAEEASAERATALDPARERDRPSGRASPTAAFSPGEELDLKLEYLHMRAGEARVVVGRPEGSLLPVICQARSDGAAMLLDIREHFVSYWDTQARAPRGSDLNAIEIGDRHTDRVRFDREGGKARVQVLRKGQLRESIRDVPGDAQDLVSALFFLRLQDLRPGARFEYPVFHGNSTFALQAEVEGHEPIETPAGRFDALRIRVRLGLPGRFETKRDSHLWLSSDGRHIPLRMTAAFAVGNVTATLVGYRPGGELSAAR